MATDAFVPSHTTADIANRITLPKHVSDHIAWLRGTEPVHVWLWLVTSGRYRLLADEQVQGDPQLEPIRLLILEGKSASVSDPTSAEEPRRAAIVARLVPTTIAPPPSTRGPGWRISFPKAFDPFVPDNCDPKAFSVLFSPEGYWEIWYTSVLRNSVFSPM